MTADRDLERVVRSWLREDDREDADRILNAVLDQVDTTPQRRATWWPVRRFLSMNGYAKFAALAATVAIVLLGVALATRPDQVGPKPTPSTNPAPPLLNEIPTGNLGAGTYQIDAVFPVDLSFSIPAGYTHGRGAADGVGIQHGEGGDGLARGIEFQIARNVFPDPCRSAAGVASPPVGPNVDDLVSAMTTLVGFYAGPVTDVTIGGLPAKAFDLTNQIDSASCNGGVLRTFAFAGTSGFSTVGTDEHQRIYVLEAQGTRLMLMTYYFPDGNPSSEADAADELSAIVDSIEFR